MEEAPEPLGPPPQGDGKALEAPLYAPARGAAPPAGWHPASAAPPPSPQPLEDVPEFMEWVQPAPPPPPEFLFREEGEIAPP